MSEEPTNQKMSVLFVTRPIAPPWDEASKNFAYHLALNLPDLKIGLLSHGKIGNLPPHLRLHPIYSSHKNSLLQKARLVINLRKVADQYDIVHFFFTPTPITSFLLSKILKNKITIQNVATLRQDLYGDKDYKKLLFADRLVTYSSTSAEKLQKLGFPTARHIFPGIDLSLYRPQEKDPSLMKNLQLTSKDFIIVYPGEYVRLGATDTIVNMILERNSEFTNENIKVIFACRVKNFADQQKKSRIQKILKRNKADHLARFPETFRTMEKVFNLSDIVIFPVQNMHGKFDIPLALVEAMACAKVLIVSNLPGINEFANHSNSVIIEPSNEEVLYQAIVKLKNNPSHRQELEQKALLKARENFDIQKIAQNYKQLYYETLSYGKNSK